MMTLQQTEASTEIDESSRLLCIGAHLDRNFANNAIREFLTEPARAIPPSLGVNPQAVLRECLAARRRRRIRDATLSVLMVVMLVTRPTLVFSWVVVAVVWRFLGPKQRRLDREQRALVGLGSLVLILVAVAFVGMTLVTAAVTLVKRLVSGGLLSGMNSGNPYGYPSDPLSGTLATGATLLPLLLSIAMLVVLWSDRHSVWSTLTGRLRRGRFSVKVPIPTGGFDALRWGIGSGPHAGNLHLIKESHVNCVVYRGSWPYVGSGPPVEPWSVAIALEPSDGGSPDSVPDLDGAVVASSRASARAAGRGESTFPPPPPPPAPAGRLSVVDLHTAVTQEVRSLVAENSLSPSNRLAGLRSEGMVYIPAHALADHVSDPLMTQVFPDQRMRPRPLISSELLQHTATHPKEWMRYHANYVIESWDREVTVSVLMHYGLDDRHLYTECTPCVLSPVNPRYSYPDALSERSSNPAFLDAVGSWTVLPLTIIPRLLHSLKRIKDTYEGSEDARRFGTAQSLREMAASGRFADYAQQTDTIRYVQILQTRIVRAIGAHLESCGLSSVEFMRRADGATNWHVYGDVKNSNLGGQNNIAGRNNMFARDISGSNLGGSGNTVDNSWN